MPRAATRPVTKLHLLPDSPDSNGIDVAAGDLMRLLSRHAGVGLWDAQLHLGDPMHADSRWRWSEEFRRLLGFAQDDVVAFPDVVGSWADRLHPEDAAPTFEKFNACLADRSGRTGYDVTYRLRMKEGSYRWFRAIGGVARGTDGVAARACGALIDIDAQKNQEQRSALLDAPGPIDSTLRMLRARSTSSPPV